MAEYIEREALLDSLRESRKALQEICKGLKFPVEKQICDAQILTFQECVLRVKEQPTADVVEIKYGKWRLETDEEMPDFMFKLVVCSVCGSKSNQMYRYCPCCGAKMKLEGDSNEQTTRYSG